MQEKKKEIFGLIGYPVKHSFSAAMHNAAFSHLGMDAEYRLFEVRPEDLEEFLLKRTDIECFNITIPHKVRAREILKKNFQNQDTDIAEYSDLVGAVNTVKRMPEGANWCNSDAPGFVRSFKEELGINGKGINVLVIGCGGAGRAVIAGLSRDENFAKNIYVYDRNPATQRSLVEYYRYFPQVRDKLRIINRENIEILLEDCSLLVNASPLGMNPGDESIIDKDLLHESLAVYDVVYNRETRLVREAREKGLKAAGGLGMLLYQGVIAFEFWTGKTAPVDIMRTALEEKLKEIQ